MAHIRLPHPHLAVALDMRSRSTIRLGQFLAAVACERYNSKNDDWVNKVAASLNQLLQPASCAAAELVKRFLSVTRGSLQYKTAVSKGVPACSPRKPCDFQVVPKPVCKLGCSTEAAHTPSTRHIPISSRRLGCSHSRRITSLRILFSRCTEHLKLLAFRCFLRFSRSSLYWRCDGSYSYGHVAT